MGLQIAYELPAGTNWNFDVHWYPKIPGVISASSFDGKIGIYNIKVQVILVVYFCFGEFSPDVFGKYVEVCFKVVKIHLE